MQHCRWLLLGLGAFALEMFFAARETAAAGTRDGLQLRRGTVHVNRDGSEGRKRL